jgi:hypothetical protein
MDDGQGGGTTIEAATEIAARLQTYMLVRFGMSVLTGLGFWVFTAVYGLELQREWGVLAFVLNFIPFIGSFVATLLPTLFAAAQFESLYAALVVFIGLNLLQFVIGSYLEPRVAGTAVSVSPFMVLVAVFFWGLLWGIAGAFIGVPIRRRQRLDRAGKIPPLDIEGGEQGGGAIALIIMCHGGAAPLLHRQSGLGAVKRLDLALLVDAEDQAWADGSM